ncbi:MAG: hypothetical protein MUF34_38230 [Polyangiaceae bacterium]|nr:hypothetical protein [Polyangiaceae bacterium]
MKSALAYAPLALSITMLGACASSDPNKKLRQAEWDAIEERQDDRTKAIERDKDMRENRLEARTDARENAADRAHAGDPDREDLREAGIAMSEERQKYRVDARARAQQLDARADALRTKLQTLGARADLDARERLDVVAKQRQLVEQNFVRLDRSNNDQWRSAKDSLNDRLDELDRLTDSAAKKILPDYPLPDYPLPDYPLPDYPLPDYPLPDYPLPDAARLSPL